jgi:hypothetical protein
MKDDLYGFFMLKRNRLPRSPVCSIQQSLSGSDGDGLVFGPHEAHKTVDSLSATPLSAD